MNVRKSTAVGALVIATLSFLSGCESVNVLPTPAAKPSDLSEAKISAGSQTAATPQTTFQNRDRTSVIWANYDPGTQAEVDLFTKNKDCRGLQSYVGMATATEASVKAKTGHGNDALLRYIGESMIIASCN